MTADMDSLLAQRQWVRDLALRLVGDSHVADDLSQETFLRALRSETRPAEIRSERAWLGTLLRNLVLERFRNDTRRRAREAAVEAQPAVPSTDEVVARASVHRQVVENVMDLPPKYREVLLLRYFEGHSPTEIAAARGEPISSIKTRLQRGIELMRGRLDAENGGDGRAWIAALAPILYSDPRPVTPLDTSIVGSKSLLVAAAILSITAFVGWLALRSSTRSSVDTLQDASRTQASATATNHENEPTRSNAGRTVEINQLRTDAALDLAAIANPLSGTVVDVQGSPVAGIVVALRPPAWLDALAKSTSIAVSGANGQFSFASTEAGLIEVLGATHIALLLGDAYSALEPGTGKRARYTVVISACSEVQGRVVADDSNLPLTDAQIEWLGPIGLRARVGGELSHSTSRRFVANTDGDGQFRVTLPKDVSGSRVRISREGFAPLEFNTIRSSTEYRLSRTGLTFGLTGQVTDAQNRPLEDVRVGDGFTVTRTDREGRFSLPRNEARRFVLAARPGMQPAQVERLANSSWPEDIVLRLAKPSLSLHGQITDEEGNPLPGARVWVDDPLRLRQRSPQPDDARIENRRVGLCAEEVNEPGDGIILENYLAGLPEARFAPIKSDASGRFEIRGLADREYVLAAVASSGGTITRQKAIHPGRTGTPVKLVVHPERVRRVEGIAKAARNGRPLAQILVRWERFLFRSEGVTGRLDMGSPVRTDANGHFELTNVPDEPNVVLRVEGRDVLTQSFPIGPSSQELAVVNRVRMRIRSVRIEKVVAFAARNRNGSELPIQSFEGRRLVTQSKVQLTAGRSPWVALPDTAVEIVGLDSSGAVVVQHAIHPEPGTALELDL